MEYVYAALILNESGEEINEENITGVLEAAGVDVEESRVKALVAALEDVDIDEAVAEAAAVPAGGAGGAAPAEGGADEAEADEGDDEEEEEEVEETSDVPDTTDDDDEEEGDGGEALGDLFG
jgi:large subunit ribosomal protein L12